MKRTLKVFFMGLGGILLAAFVIGLLLPNEWDAEAQATMQAEPSEIHAYVGDFNRWGAWATTSMKAEDPTAEVTVTGSGVGATMTWQGDKMGRGRIVITESDPLKGIRYEAAIEGEEVNGHGSITYEKTDEGTLVTWKDQGELPPFIGGYFSGMVNQALSEHFGRSLELLKQIVERP